MDLRLGDTWLKVRAALGRVGIAFFVCLIASFTGVAFWSGLAQILCAFFGVWLCVRWLRHLTRQAIWRLRNRLLVTYLFIAVVPLLLIATLAGLGAYAAASQFAVHLMNLELDRRIETLSSMAERLALLKPEERRYAMTHMLDIIYQERFQGVRVVLREGGQVLKYPDDESIQPPPQQWKTVSGIVHQGSRFYGWAHRTIDGGDITVSAPFPARYMAELIPALGIAQLFLLGDRDGNDTKSSRNGIQVRIDSVDNGAAKVIANNSDEGPAPQLKPGLNRFDFPVEWVSFVPVYSWDKPGEGDQPSASERAVLQVQSRPSMIFDVLFSRKTDELRGLLPSVLIGIAILFLVVELVALVIGVSMTRTITRAIHRLYEGTERVMQGDFSHRIEVQGKDQLADLGYSFNRMTENVEQLLAISKEKERLQSELEIAREVQNQLYPKTAPDLKRLKVRALCQPARMVSGDYYDYDLVSDQQLAIAIGDVAGKGISAALLMATLQSSVRTQLSFSSEAMAAGKSCFSPSVLVSHLNTQLYKTTSPEKYSTFFLGLFDANSCLLRYTNAGHLPPILFRDGETTNLEIDGTVVGAFPHAEFGESALAMQQGDLLLCYTDGITEPENAYGEMFGEERLIEIVHRNSQKSEEQILQAVVESVLAWTGSPELQDDMTLVLARCL